MSLTRTSSRCGSFSKSGSRKPAGWWTGRFPGTCTWRGWRSGSWLGCSGSSNLINIRITCKVNLTQPINIRITCNVNLTQKSKYLEFPHSTPYRRPSSSGAQSNSLSLYAVHCSLVQFMTQPVEDSLFLQFVRLLPETPQSSFRKLCCFATPQSKSSSPNCRSHLCPFPRIYPQLSQIAEQVPQIQTDSRISSDLQLISSWNTFEKGALTPA